MQGNAETAGQAVQDEAQQAQAVPQRAIERIPQKGVTKDEDGNEMPAYDWEKAKPEDTYDALKDEIFGGDEKQTADPVNATIREIESEGKAKQEQLDKISVAMSLPRCATPPNARLSKQNSTNSGSASTIGEASSQCLHRGPRPSRRR